MADCSYHRCIQERRFIKRELQKWCKDMVYIVGECLKILKTFLLFSRTRKTCENFFLPFSATFLVIAQKKLLSANHPPKAACCFKLYYLCASLSGTFRSLPSRSGILGCCAVAAVFASGSTKNLLPKINVPNIHSHSQCRLSRFCLTCGRKVSTPKNVNFLSTSSSSLQTNLLNFINLAMTTRHISPRSPSPFLGYRKRTEILCTKKVFFFFSR
jgi:hypothetical protein